jgi:biopolymer transport protein ExbD
MTVSKLPSDRRRVVPDNRVDLNLLPFMNLMTLLIPFLLASIQFMTLAVVDVSMPSIAPVRTTTPPDATPEPPLELTIGITESEFVVRGKTERLAEPATIPIDDLAGLTALMVEVREERPAACDPPGTRSGWAPPEACNVILAPDSNVLYERVIEAMDATRETQEITLFPYVVVAGGVLH